MQKTAKNNRDQTLTFDYQVTPMSQTSHSLNDWPLCRVVAVKPHPEHFNSRSQKDKDSRDKETFGVERKFLKNFKCI
jgi:hypothetical protein